MFNFANLAPYIIKAVAACDARWSGQSRSGQREGGQFRRMEG